MENEIMGTFIIFDTIQYEDDWQHERSGSNSDTLRKSMAKLGFRVKLYKNPTRQRIFQVLKEETCNETPVNAFGCAICTHGWYHGWLTTYKRNEFINVKEIQHYLHEDVCPALNGKPKLLIVQGLFHVNFVRKK